MSGITGFCDFNRKLNGEHLNTANGIPRHGGSDGGNSVLFETENASIGFGHRKLSILGISENGSQPMYNDDKSIVLILNGEVYNFKEIRKDLVDAGYSFRSDSNTEVIIKAYEQFGIDAVSKFIGMFSFAIYDLRKQIIYMVRDRAGVKPLYYYYKNGSLLFASELKSIYTYPVFEKNINENAVMLFFKYGYIKAPYTIFNDTFKVLPGHYIKIDLTHKKVEQHKYWDVLDYYNKPKLKISEDEALQETERLFASAFQYRMVSDMPVGVFLSGGYDSSLVAAILQKNSTQKIKTFTIGFEEDKYNEAPHAKKIAQYLGTDHHEYYSTKKEAQDILPKLPDIYDEPFGDTSGISTTLVSQFAKKYVTVSLSGHGGNEIFAGYYRYDSLLKQNKIIERIPGVLLSLGEHLINLSVNIFPGLRKTHKIERLIEVLNTYKQNGLIDISSRHFNHRSLSELMPGYDDNINLTDNMGQINNGNDLINKVLAFDYLTYMADDILTKVDRATMAVGLQCREPLLDHRIIEFVSQLPSDLKYNNGEKKYLLKKITHKYLPREMMDRPKSGFSIPVHKWFTTDLEDYLMSYINEEQLSKHNLLNAKKAISIRDEFLAGNTGKETPV